MEGGGEHHEPNGGDIQIVSFNGSNQLRFGNSTDGGENITRAVDLAGKTTAILSFNWQEDDRDSGRKRPRPGSQSHNQHLGN